MSTHNVPETFSIPVGPLQFVAGLLPGSGRATLAAGPLARFDAPGLLAR